MVDLYFTLFGSVRGLFARCTDSHGCRWSLFFLYAIHTTKQQSILLLMETFSLQLPTKKKKKNFLSVILLFAWIIITLVKRFTKGENCKLDVLLSRFIYFPFFNTFSFASSGKKKKNNQISESDLSTAHHTCKVSLARTKHTRLHIASHFQSISI